MTREEFWDALVLQLIARGESVEGATAQANHAMVRRDEMVKKNGTTSS